MKKYIVNIIRVIIILAILLVPIPGGPYVENGTKTYTALTYTIVVWKTAVPIETGANGDIYVSQAYQISTYRFPSGFMSYREMHEAIAMDIF